MTDGSLKLSTETYFRPLGRHHFYGGVSHVGRNFAPMAPANSSSVESRPWLPCLEELLILNRPCRPGEDVKDSVLPRSYWQAWWNWESTKKEFETIATKAGVIWFVDEDEVVKRILEVVCRDEIAMAITYQEAKEHDTFKEGRATTRRRKDGPFSKTQSSST